MTTNTELAIAWPDGFGEQKPFRMIIDCIRSIALANDNSASFVVDQLKYFYPYICVDLHAEDAPDGLAREWAQKIIDELQPALLDLCDQFMSVEEELDNIRQFAIDHYNEETKKYLTALNKYIEGIEMERSTVQPIFNDLEHELPDPK